MKWSHENTYQDHENTQAQFSILSAVSISTNGASSEAAMAPLNNISAGRESLKARTYALQIPTKGILARNEVE